MLETIDLTYQLDKRPIIHHFSYQFSPGKLYGLYGPNGSGKTTLFKLLKKLLTPTSGQIYLNQTKLDQLSFQEISQMITLVPQNPMLTFPYTVEEFIQMGRYPHNSSISSNFYREVLEMTDLYPLLHQPVNEISGGERQRAYIARSLLTESPIMLFDEPTANLDKHHHQKIRSCLNNLTFQGKTVIVATHDMPDLYAFDKVIEI